jgi:Protein of unknown function (DUF3108)
MKVKAFGVALILLLPALTLPASGALGRTLRTEYAVSVRGFPVGRAELQAEITGGHYSIQFSGGIRGLARLFSNVETSAAAIGEVGMDQLEPDEYKHLWRENSDTEAVDMHFVDRRLTEVNVDPPRRHPERYVPLTDMDKLDVLDPVSAFVWPVAGVTPAICSRTLPLMDGKIRFDIALAFSRMETFSTNDRSYSDRAVVCSFRYEQVAGYRIGRKNDDSITDGSGMEVWMTPAGNGLAAPARIQLSTRLGEVVFVATKFETQ